MEKAARRPESSLSVSKGAVRKKRTDSLAGSVVIGHGKWFQTKRERFRLVIRKKFL